MEGEGSGLTSSNGSAQNQELRKRKNDETVEESPAKKAKVERFTLEEDINKWELPKELAEYALEKLNTYLTDKQIEEGILKDFPVPSNLNLSKELDAYMKRTVEEKKNKQSLSLDKALENIQKKLGFTFGPLGAMWEFLEQERAKVSSQCEDSDQDSEEVKTANQMCNVMEIMVTLLGQAFNSITYYRRRNILLSIMSDKKQVKDILKDNVDVLEENKGVKLFGDKFEERVVQQLKLMKKSKEFLGVSDKSSRGNSGSQPFRTGPLSYQHSGRGQTLNRRTFGSRRGGTGRGFVVRGGRGNYRGGPFFGRGRGHS